MKWKILGWNMTGWTRTVFIISGVGISLSIMASCGGSSMTQHQLIAIAVSPTGAGANQGDTVTFSATGTFAQAPTTQPNIPAQWTSSDTTTATINPSTGAATCVGIGGPVTITASAAGMAGTLESTGELTCAAPGTGPVKLVPNSLTFACDTDLTGSCSCSPPETTTLTNSLSTSLTINSITVGGTAFSESNNCGTSVGPGQSCKITVSWTPQTIPDTGGPVTISDSDSTSPQTVSLPVLKRCNP
jgi:trimeric autotransporter adhesin